MSDILTSSSASSRAQSVSDLLKVRDFFILGCLSSRDDAYHVPAFSVSHDNRTPLAKSDCDKSRLIVGKAGILYSHGIAVKYGGHISEVNAMFVEVGFSFVFVPLEFHGLIVVTIRSYVKKGARISSSMV